MNEHGGKRSGSGRKPKNPEDRYKRVDLTLPPDVIEFLAMQKNASQYVTELIRKEMQRRDL